MNYEPTADERASNEVPARHFTARGQPCGTRQKQHPRGRVHNVESVSQSYDSPKSSSATVISTWPREGLLQHRLSTGPSREQEEHPEVKALRWQCTLGSNHSSASPTQSRCEQHWPKSTSLQQKTGRNKCGRAGRVGPRVWSHIVQNADYVVKIQKVPHRAAGLRDSLNTHGTATCPTADAVQNNPCMTALYQQRPVSARHPDVTSPTHRVLGRGAFRACHRCTDRGRAAC